MEPTTSPTEESAGDEATVTAEAPTEEGEPADDSEETAESDDESDDAEPQTDGVNIDLFFDGALAEEAAVVECTLSDGTETMCYEITVVGYPVNHEIGPFCPETTSTDASEAGIWFDGNDVYDADGAFILTLGELYGDDNWKLYNDDGTVKITDTPEAFEAAARPDVDPAYYNYCAEGQMEWLENGEPVPATVTIPINPVMSERTSAGGNWGITLNGVTIAAPAPVDAILGAYTIAPFDDCGGHINPYDGYHMHGAYGGCSENGEVLEGEPPIFAYAMDGFAIHSPLSEEEAATVNLDECNGHTTEEFGYHYHANPAEENSVISCFKGLTVAGNGGDRGGGQNGGRDGQGRPPAGGDVGRGGAGGPPNFVAAAEKLGISEQELRDALGGPPPNFLVAAAATLGISEEALQEALAGE